MDKSVVVLAVDGSENFGGDKGLLVLEGKPVLQRLVDSVGDVADEIVVVVASQEQADSYAEILPADVRFVCDADGSRGLLGAALTGFEAAQNKYCALLPFNAPFVSTDVVSLLFDLCVGKSAVVPRSPDCEVETLHAVYNKEQFLEAAKLAVARGELDLAELVCKMRGVRYLSTLVVGELDPDMKTFFTVNTEVDLKRAAVMLKPRRHR